eukprot:CFRG0597T1
MIETQHLALNTDNLTSDSKGTPSSGLLYMRAELLRKLNFKKKGQSCVSKSQSGSSDGNSDELLPHFSSKSPHNQRRNAPTLWDTCEPRSINDLTGFQGNPILRGRSLSMNSTINSSSVMPSRREDYRLQHIAPMQQREEAINVQDDSLMYTSARSLENLLGNTSSSSGIYNINRSTKGLVSESYAPMYSRRKASNFLDSRRHSVCGSRFDTLQEVSTTPKKDPHSKVYSNHSGQSYRTIMNTESASIMKVHPTGVGHLDGRHVYNMSKPILLHENSSSSCSSDYNALHSPLGGYSSKRESSLHSVNSVTLIVAKPLNLGKEVVYDGQLNGANCLFHGSGVLATPDYYYFGGWYDGSPRGLGVYVNIRDKYKYEGTFEYGFADGFGRLVYLGDDPQYYYGFFVGGRLSESKTTTILADRRDAALSADKARDLMDEYIRTTNRLLPAA